MKLTTEEFEKAKGELFGQFPDIMCSGGAADIRNAGTFRFKKTYASFRKIRTLRFADYNSNQIIKTSIKNMHGWLFLL